MSATIGVEHRSRPAYVYVRQSTLAQVRHNQESTERQYALRDKALALGWTLPTIRTLDRDLGVSGAQMAGREDFKTLVADVSMGQVGAVFALEVSRLARSNLDWHRLLELCALTQTLVIDEDGCYDPADFNDGLLLGLKGTMAQETCSKKTQFNFMILGDYAKYKEHFANESYPEAFVWLFSRRRYPLMASNVFRTCNAATKSAGTVLDHL